MTFSEIVDIAVKRGFIIYEQKNYYSLCLEKKEGINVVLNFPNDTLTTLNLHENVNVSWGFQLLDAKTGSGIYNDWFDIYSGTAGEKIDELKSQVLEFVIKVSSFDLRINRRPLISILGYTILKEKVLQFKNNDTWVDFN